MSCVLGNLEIWEFVGFFCQLFAFPHVVPFLEATSDLGQLRLSLLKGDSR